MGQEYEFARYTKEECILDKRKLLLNYRKAKEQGKLKPPKKRVPVVPAPPKPEKSEKAEGVEGKKGKPAAAVKAKKKPVGKKKAVEKAESAEKNDAGQKEE